MRAAIGIGLGWLTALACATTPAMANPLKSRLTAIDLSDCKLLKRHPDGNAYRCPGLPGWPVYVASGDDRQFLSFGPSAEKRQAASQTLGAFNSVFERGKRPAIEWRIERKGGREVPFATIVRFHTQRDGSKGEVLVVTKVDAKISCRLALVDAAANPDGMALARSWTDANARAQSCPGTPAVIGNTGTSPM